MRKRAQNNWFVFVLTFSILMFCCLKIIDRCLHILLISSTHLMFCHFCFSASPSSCYCSYSSLSANCRKQDCSFVLLFFFCVFGLDLLSVMDVVIKFLFIKSMFCLVIIIFCLLSSASSSSYLLLFPQLPLHQLLFFYSLLRIFHHPLAQWMSKHLGVKPPNSKTRLYVVIWRPLSCDPCPTRKHKFPSDWAVMQREGRARKLFVPKQFSPPKCAPQKTRKRTPVSVFTLTYPESGNDPPMLKHRKHLFFLEQFAHS